MTNYIQTNQVITIPNTAVYNLTHADSGKLIMVTPPTAASVINLPSLQAGLRFKFMVLGNFGGGGLTSTITPTLNGVAVNASLTGTCMNITPGGAGAAIVAAVTKAASNTLIIEETALQGDYV
ncbi:MAG TPA: hypothetical protein PLS50_08200, partial [Candidatus Dojkabacteria bacterium]|nr:hypothetical protein [Candidatus Dojkabacteria bacterium]